MDTDGSVSTSNIRFGVISENLTKNLQGILDLIGIPTIIKKRKEKKGGHYLYSVTIKKIYLKVYNPYIGFSNSRKQKNFSKQ